MCDRLIKSMRQSVTVSYINVGKWEAHRRLDGIIYSFHHSTFADSHAAEEQQICRYICVRVCVATFPACELQGRHNEYTYIC